MIRISLSYTYSLILVALPLKQFLVLASHCILEIIFVSQVTKWAITQASYMQLDAYSSSYFSSVEKGFRMLLFKMFNQITGHVHMSWRSWLSLGTKVLFWLVPTMTTKIEFTIYIAKIRMAKVLIEIIKLST